MEGRGVPCPPPTSCRPGSQTPPTCKHRGAVGIADVGVRGSHILGVEDEDPQHDWHELGPWPRGAERAGEGRGEGASLEGAAQSTGSRRRPTLKRSGLGGHEGRPSVPLPRRCPAARRALGELGGLCSSSTFAVLPGSAGL